MKKIIDRIHEGNIFTGRFYKTQFTGSTGYAGQRDFEVSLTVPDMAMSIPDLLARAARGLPLPTVPLLNADIDLSQFDKMTQFDRIDYARRLSARQAVLHQELAESKRKQALAKHEADVNAQVESKLKDLLTIKPQTDVPKA